MIISRLSCCYPRDPAVGRCSYLEAAHIPPPVAAITQLGSHNGPFCILSPSSAISEANSTPTTCVYRLHQLDHQNGRPEGELVHSICSDGVLQHYHARRSAAIIATRLKMYSPCRHGMRVASAFRLCFGDGWHADVALSHLVLATSSPACCSAMRTVQSYRSSSFLELRCERRPAHVALAPTANLCKPFFCDLLVGAGGCSPLPADVFSILRSWVSIVLQRGVTRLSSRRVQRTAKNYVQVPNFAYAIAVQAKISTTIDKLTHK